MRAGIFASVITLLCSAKKLLQKRLPLGGKLARKRLMRGDKSPPTQSFCFLTHPTHKSGAKPHPVKNPYLPNRQKNFPQAYPPHTKRNKSLLCMGGCAWGKFSGGQGGLEGRNPSPKEGFLRLQGLPPPPQKFSAAPMTVPNWEFSGIRKRTPNPPDAVIDSKTRRIGAIVVRLPVRTMSRRL